MEAATRRQFLTISIACIESMKRGSGSESKQRGTISRWVSQQGTAWVGKSPPIKHRWVDVACNFGLKMNEMHLERIFPSTFPVPSRKSPMLCGTWKVLFFLDQDAQNGTSIPTRRIVPANSDHAGERISHSDVSWPSEHMGHRWAARKWQSRAQKGPRSGIRRRTIVLVNTLARWRPVTPLSRWPLRPAASFTGGHSL